MRKAVRAELDRIETFLLQNNTDARHLWDILSALRGPDKTEDAMAKAVTTCVIRRRAFPKLAKSTARYNIPASFRSMSGRNPRYPLVRKFEGFQYEPHFEKHIRVAAVAIVAKNEKPYQH